MKQITSFLLLLVVLFSCVDDKDYPVQFSYDYSVKSLIEVDDHLAILRDSALEITGNHPDGTIYISIPRAPGHAITVGDFTTELNTGFSIHFKSSIGVITKAQKATLELRHVNSYADFEFEAQLFNGIKLTKGIGKNLPIVTEAYFNSIDTNGVLPIPQSNLDTVQNGLFAEMDDLDNPFHQSSENINKAETDTSFQFSATSGDFRVSIELMKPLELLLDKEIDITQTQQDLVRMQWIDITKPPGNNLLFLQHGNFNLFEIKQPSDIITFGFSGQLANQDQTEFIPIELGYGKDI